MKTNFVGNKIAISTAVIALVAIVVVAAVAGGIYFATTQNKPSSPFASESPTPSAAVSQSPTPVATASAAPTETVNPSASAAPKVADASSLQYSVSLSADTERSTRNIHLLR
jgi:flagellar basal body-associated protein FliL